MTIRAFAQFANRHSDVQFTIVGDDPERACFENLIRDLGLEKQVWDHLGERLLKIYAEVLGASSQEA